MLDVDRVSRFWAEFVLKSQKLSHKQDIHSHLCKRYGA